MPKWVPPFGRTPCYGPENFCGNTVMMQRLAQIFLAAFALLLIAGGSAALAHPHVWVTMKSELVYAPDGTLTGVRHAWTFDEMFSTFATQGIETKKKGEFTREELKPLAEVNVTSLKEYGYFTYLKAAGKKVPLVDPVDYFLEFKDSALTLHFMLPLKAPIKSAGFEVEIFDPDYFVDFTFAEKDPVALVSAPEKCQLAVARPGDAAVQGKPGESFFQQPDAANFGAQFASRISVKCP